MNLSVIPFKIKIFLEPDGKMPTKGKSGDAGLDVYADLKGLYKNNPELFDKTNDKLIIKPFIVYRIPLGFHYGIFEAEYEQEYKVSTNFWLEPKNRSGFGTSNGITTVADVCDASYRGIPHYCFVKCTTNETIIEHGQKIAQLIIHPFVDPHKMILTEVKTLEELGTSSRGDNGFGSTGK